MAISKLVLNGVTQMDVTQDTVAANKLLSGETATKNDGTKVTGTIASKSSSDLTVSGPTVTAPAGFYSSNASKSVATGTATAPASISGTSATISTGVVGTTGLMLTKTVSVTPNVTTAGYISSGTAGNSSVSLAADIPIQGDITLTELSGTITAPAGYYPNAASRTVAAGTAGTPTATKGTVSNNSVSVTPSVTNTTGYITGSTKTGTPVTVSASELVSGNLDITENGENIDVTNYATVSVDVAGGGASGLPGAWYQDENGYIVISDEPVEKQINFYDYNGTRLYSYSSQEWADVSALPENPSHTRFTSQGWNWTKGQIDTQLANAPGGVINVGQMYITKSGATEIDILLDDPDYLNPYLFVRMKGSIEIDWGDGSNRDTITGTSSYADQRLGHLYSNTGLYTVSIIVPNLSGCDFYVNTNVESPIFTAMTDGYVTSNKNMVYSNAVRGVYFGNNFRMAKHSFWRCANLEYITIPQPFSYDSTNKFVDTFYYTNSLKFITFPSTEYTTSYNDLSFSYCTSLFRISIPCNITTIPGQFSNYGYGFGSITIPNTVTTIGNAAFYYNRKIRKIVIPNSVTSIGSTAFNWCESLTEVTIGNGVTSIGSDAFGNTSALKKVHILATTPPTLGSSSIFYNTNNCAPKIYVPYSADHSILNAYKTATNWSTYADKIEEEPQT